MKVNVCPSLLTEGYDTYSPAALRRLFAGASVSYMLDFDFEKDVYRQVISENMGRISVSGAQEKMSAVVDNGTIRLASEGERSTHILKPAPLDYDLVARKQIPANEHLTMQIASQVYGIITAENGLCFDRSNHPVYITKRFDILPDGNKARMDDFAVIVGRNEQTDGKYFKYEGCYEDIAVAIKKVIPAWPVALDRFFRLVLFNYIYGNGDAHMKNFSIINSGNENQLAPAYDLLNTSLHLNGDDLGLKGGILRNGWKSDVFENTGHPCRTDFETFGKQIGLTPRRISSAIKDFLLLPDKTVSLIEHSFLDKKMQRKYLSIVKERLSRFNRQSE